MSRVTKFLALASILLISACSHGRGHKGMHMIDSDKDGSVSKAEWSKHFDDVDANKDGKMSKDELHSFHKIKCDKDEKDCKDQKNCKDHKGHHGASDHHDMSSYPKGKGEKCAKGKCADCAKGKAHKCDASCNEKNCPHKKDEST